MNLLSEHNRILRVGEGGSQEYFAGPNINITDHVISGKYWDNEINSAISSTSGDIVNEAFNQSTAWTEEQGYLTAHQDVSNLPYVQNSALGYNGNLISSISGNGFFAESANNSYHADDADHATYADSATHADSADFVATANFANSASSALNAEIANVTYTALTAQFLDGGWELDVDGFITAYNNSAFAGAGGGGRYEGIEPIVVNNEEMRISAKSALLGVQEPLYFVEDSETATVIGIHDSAISGKGIEYSGIAPIVVDNENHLISAQSAKLGVQGPLYFVEDTPTSTVIGIDNSVFPTFEGTPDGKISAINGSALNADSVIVPLSEFIAIICEWIKGAEHKDLMQRKHFKLDLFELLQKMKVVLPDEYKNRLLHLDDVQPIENTENAYKEQIDYIRIDEIRLKEHFTISFIRNGFESLISLLKIKHDPKGFAMIAHQIYKSKHFRRGDFNTFSAWYRTFCEIVGCKYCKSYKPSKLKLTEEQEVSFLFLK